MPTLSGSAAPVTEGSVIPPLSETALAVTETMSTFQTNFGKNGLWLLGPARSGKTSKGVIVLGSQLIHRVGHPNDGPLIVLDIKGDMAAFQSMRLEAARAGRVFKWFTNEPHMTSFIFNPWDQKNLRGMTIGQKADGFANALGLWAGFGYGRLFFSMRDRNSLAENRSARSASQRRKWLGWARGFDARRDLFEFLPSWLR